MKTKQILQLLAAIEKTGYYLHRKELPKRALIYEIKHAQKVDLLKVLTRL